MRLTKKQVALIRAISKNDESGNFPDLDIILGNLEYKTTKQSLQFSIRKLEGRGFIEKRNIELRRGQNRRVLSLTESGYRVLNTKS